MQEQATTTHLHSNLAVVNQNLPRQEIGTNGGLVAGAELLVDLYHKASRCQYSACPGAEASALT